MNWKTESIIFTSMISMLVSLFAVIITKNFLYFIPFIISALGLAYGFMRKFIFEDEEQKEKSVNHE